MNISKFRHGCDKAPVSSRDRIFSSPPLSGDLQPVDLRPWCPTVRDQGDIGSCTAFGSTELYDFVRKKHGLPQWLPSPLFTYYATRLMTNTVSEDCGALVRTAIQSTVKHGVVMERDWPYDTTMFAVNPLSSVWESAERHQTLEYLKVDDYNKHVFVGCLMEGYPFAFGLRLFESFFNTSSDGVVRVPDFNTEKEVGGHCMLAVGYQSTDHGEFIIVQNSWGKNWGHNGCCYVPMSYMLSNYSYDFWTIRLTETCDTDTPDAEPVPTPTPTIVVPVLSSTHVETPTVSAMPIVETVIMPQIEDVVPTQQHNTWKRFIIMSASMIIIAILYYLFTK